MRLHLLTLFCMHFTVFDFYLWFPIMKLKFFDWILNFKCSFDAGALFWGGPLTMLIRMATEITVRTQLLCACAHMNMRTNSKNCGWEGGWTTPSSPQFQALKWHNNNNNTCATLVPSAPDRIDCCVLVHMASICFMQTSCWGSCEFNQALRKLRALARKIPVQAAPHGNCVFHACH